MATKFNLKKLEEALANPKTSSKDLFAAVKSISLLKNLKPKDVFPIGIIATDGVRVRVEMKLDKLTPFVNDFVALQDGIVRSWRVFPIGIVVPERLLVEIDIGQAFGP